MSGRLQRGVNLIELIVSIVIISIAVTGVLLVFTQTVRFSADPMIEQQATAIAEAYLDEILARPVDDPNGGEVGIGAAEAGETRSLFDDVKDYSTLVGESPPRDHNGIVLAGLEPYSATVTVTPDVNIGPVGAQVQVAQVEVVVTHPSNVRVVLTGYRAE